MAASYIHHSRKLPTSMVASAARTLWNKMLIGTNCPKTTGLTPAQAQFLGRCEFCDGVYHGEDYFLRHYSPTSVAILSKLGSDITILMKNYPTSLTPCRQFVRAIRDLARPHPDGTSIWTDLWRDSVLHCIRCGG